MKVLLVPDGWAALQFWVLLLLLKKKLQKILAVTSNLTAYA